MLRFSFTAELAVQLDERVGLFAPGNLATGVDYPTGIKSTASAGAL
jgi:hypothetical protein